MHEREEKFEKFIKYEHDLKELRAYAWKRDINNVNEKINGGTSFIGILETFYYILCIAAFICIFFAPYITAILVVLLFFIKKYGSAKYDEHVVEWQKRYGFHIDDCMYRHEKFVDEMRKEISDKEASLKMELQRINEAIAKYEKL